jgi:HEAT repeat protein
VVPGRALLLAHPKDDGFWVSALLEALVDIGAPDRAAWLGDQLGDTRWEVRARAALALGRHHPGETREALERALAEVSPDGDTGFEAALCFALDRATAARANPWRKRFVARFGPEAPPISPFFLSFLVELVRIWRTREVLPAIRTLAAHPSPFVRSEALETLGELRDTGGIAAALSRLDDAAPGVRAAALAALERITGRREPRGAEGWKAWCAASRCLDAGDPHP